MNSSRKTITARLEPAKPVRSALSGLLCVLFAFFQFSAPCSAADLPTPTFGAIVYGHSIAIDFKLGKFYPKRRIFSTRKSPDGNRVLLNGKPVVGTDNSVPQKISKRSDAVIDSITLRWDDKKVPVPVELFDHVLFPSLKTSFTGGNPPDLSFTVDPSGEAVIVSMKAGEGAGIAYVHWLFRKNGKHQLINDSFFGLTP